MRLQCFVPTVAFTFEVENVPNLLAIGGKFHGGRTF